MAATRTPISTWFGRFVGCRVNAHLAQTSYQLTRNEKER